MEAHDKDWELPLAVSFGDAVFDFGQVTVPGLFLTAYRDLGMDDQEAVFLIHLFAQKTRGMRRTFRLADLPMACSLHSRQRYLHNLRERGLVFARKVYSGFPARVRCIELDLYNLLHNLYRWEEWNRNGRPGEEFTITLSPLVAVCIRADLKNAGRRVPQYYHYVPDRWKEAARALPIPEEIVDAAARQDKRALRAVSSQFGYLLHGAVNGQIGSLLHAVNGQIGSLLQAHGKERENNGNQETVIRAPPNFSSAVLSGDALGEADSVSGILTVLDHFVSRVAERWPTVMEQGQPLARAVAERYEVACSLLSTPVAPAAVAQAPADLVEELWILAQVLRDREPAELASAIDRALMREDKSPCRRLAVIWPRVPGAENLKQHLRKNLREGGGLPDGGGYRDARRLFILLNRFDVGPPLLERFLEPCREAGVGVVLDILQEALRAGRTYVSLAFLEKAVRRRRGRSAAVGPPGNTPAEKSGPPDDGDAAEPEAEPAAVQSRLAPGGNGVFPPPDGLVRMWLADYGITEPALSELQTADYALVRAWMLYLESQKRLTPEVRQAILVSRLRDGSDPPGKWMRLARMLPRLDPVEEFMLEEEYHRRQRDGRWPEDVLEVVGEEAAERWLEFRRRLEV